jgi:hypothetical protein
MAYTLDEQHNKRAQSAIFEAFNLSDMIVLLTRGRVRVRQGIGTKFSAAGLGPSNEM